MSKKNYINRNPQRLPVGIGGLLTEEENRKVHRIKIKVDYTIVFTLFGLLFLFLGLILGYNNTNYEAYRQGNVVFIAGNYLHANKNGIFTGNAAFQIKTENNITNNSSIVVGLADFSQNNQLWIGKCTWEGKTEQCIWVNSQKTVTSTDTLVSNKNETYWERHYSNQKANVDIYVIPGAKIIPVPFLVGYSSN